MEKISKKELLIWMAGFVDGEGSIGINSVAKGKTYIAKLTVCNTNKKSILLFERKFGGKTRLRKWKGIRKDNWKPCYEWCLTNKAAVNAIKQLRPYLQIKNKQADLVIELGRLKSTYDGIQMRWDRKLRDKMWRIFAKLKEKTKKLNKRGIK